MNDKSNREEKREALISDLREVVARHGVIVDKYSNKKKGETNYVFKIALHDIDVPLEEIFAVVRHG